MKKAILGGLAIIALLVGAYIGSITEASSYCYTEYGECYDDIHYH